MTAIPIRPPALIDRQRSAIAMLLAPMAAMPIAIGMGLVGWLGSWMSAPPLVTAGIMLALAALGSRAIHLDGLADTADGLTASYDREKALEVMSKGDCGPAGAAALVFTILIQIASIANIVPHRGGPIAVALLILVSRGGLILACVRGVPAARPAGLGAMVAGSVSVVQSCLAGLCLAAGMVGAAVLVDKPWWQGLMGIALAALVIAALVGRCRRRLGGITGDVLGATIEIGVTVLAVSLAVG